MKLLDTQVNKPNNKNYLDIAPDFQKYLNPPPLIDPSASAGLRYWLLNEVKSYNNEGKFFDVFSYPLILKEEKIRYIDTV